jgi:hypothetical protein
MSRMCGEHEGSLSMLVAGIHICTAVKQLADNLDVTTLDRIFPAGIHQSKLQTIILSHH